MSTEGTDHPPLAVPILSYSVIVMPTFSMTKVILAQSVPSTNVRDVAVPSVVASCCWRISSTTKTALGMLSPTAINYGDAIANGPIAVQHCSC